MGREPPPPPPQASTWASVHTDILGVVLNFLPCAADRAAVRSVSRHWRAAARGHCLPPPLPVLVLPKFRFSCLSSRGAMTAPRVPGCPRTRRAMTTVAWARLAAGLRTAGEFVNNGNGECFLVNAFSDGVIHLPRLKANCNASIYSKSIRIVNDNDSGFVHTASGKKYGMLLCNNAVLSATPNSGSKCIVAAIFQYTICIAWGSDLAYYHGKLYMIWNHVIYPLLRSKHNYSLRFQMVVWRGKLLLIIRNFDARKIEPEIVKVEVFALDISTSRVTEIHSFDGDCIFVGNRSCKSFSAGLHVGVQGDLIYFADGYDGVFSYKNRLFDGYMVCNIRDGTIRPLAVEFSPTNSGAPEVHLDIPVWFCPSE
ncbi:LOW QUALITY PROTEIN: hypothetical protein SETIT_8G172000v2 [Setaria italica]|uniref:KIB1-4 beta-propeller domain-containing protein n=1 Tax=Setaria italica TaxID=4555 RepID=A0A368S8P9_SETIT|nr:LOW QUALITY PROTEIN: hypothetical protein SETIT_8G172000v2 [Setaria italica]